MTDVVLDVRAAVLRRGDAVLLDGVGLTVRAGEHWALLGPNGCGKTTLLSLLGALQHPTSGTVDVLGHRLGRVDVQGELLPRIGHVQGRHRPAGRLTAEEVVLTGLTGTNGLPLRRLATATERDQVQDSLRSLGVDGLAERLWSTLSNGEQRRTLIARALVRRPDLLLLDEPAAGLDLPARERLVDALDALAVDRPDLAWVLVSHHVEELPASTTHAALLRGGRLVAGGRVEDVLVDGPMSQCFAMSLQVSADHGRWLARSARRS